MSKSAKFYLEDANIATEPLGPVSSLYLDQIQHIADGEVSDLLQGQPIYVLGQMGESKRIMGSEIKSITVHGGKLILELALP